MSRPLRAQSPPWRAYTQTYTAACFADVEAAAVYLSPQGRGRNVRAARAHSG